MNIQTRSALVFAASAHIPGRYELCQVTAKAARKLHRRNDRMQDTVNEVLTTLDGKSVFRASSDMHKPSPSKASAAITPSLTSTLNPSPIIKSHLAFVRKERNFSHV